MTVYEFYGFIEGAKGRFKEYLKDGINWNDDESFMEFIEFLMRLVEACTNVFEETVLIENMAEVYLDLEKEKAA